MIKEYRRMEMSALRKLCIRMSWYDIGTNEQYDKLLNMATAPNITTSRLEKMARDIKMHTALNLTDGMDVTDIMYDLAGICYTVFEEE